MPRGVKVQKLQKGLGKHSKEDIGLMQQMFEQMTGSSDAEADVILPKYLSIRHRLITFVKTYNILIDFSPLHTTFPEFQSEFKEITDFIKKIQTDCDLTDLSEKENDKKPEYEKLSQEELNIAYKELKNKECVKTIITTAGRLARHSKMLESQDDLKDGFIKREPGLSMCLLSFSKLDFKHMWLSPKITPIIKKFMLTILSHTYEISYSMYDTITSPDIDIRKFSNILVTSLDAMRKQIPRCDDAFNIISNSVKLLEGKFKNYYKSSVEAENPSMILESFVIDVSMQQSSTNMKVAQQFKKIIMHMRKAATDNKDPRVKKIFSMLNTQFKSMEGDSQGDPLGDPSLRPSDGEPPSSNDDLQTESSNISSQIEESSSSPHNISSQIEESSSSPHNISSQIEEISNLSINDAPVIEKTSHVIDIEKKD